MRFFSSLETLVSSVGFTPRQLLLAAGATAAAAGAYYLLASTVRDQQRRHAVEALDQISSVDTVPVISQVKPRALCTETPSTLINSPQLECPELFLEQVEQVEQVDGQIQNAFRTVLFSYRWWHSPGSDVGRSASVQGNSFSLRVCVQRHCALLIRGNISYSWWISTKDLFIVPGECPILYTTSARVTVTERIDGHLTRVVSFTFTPDSSSKTDGGVQGTEVSVTGQALVMSHNEWEQCRIVASQLIPHSDPQPDVRPSSQPTGPQATRSSDSSVVREVPSLHNFSVSKSIGSFALKLNALRQAFTIILSEEESLDYVCDTGRVILGDLAVLNDRVTTDQVFQQLYNALVWMAQSPRYQPIIEEELAEIGIQSFNFMDVIYELVMFQIQAGTGPQICPRPGGFLHHLTAMMSSLSATTMQSRPKADQYLLLVQNGMMVFLETILSLEEAVYKDPESLASIVWEIFEGHTEDLLTRLEEI